MSAAAPQHTASVTCSASFVCVFKKRDFILRVLQFFLNFHHLSCMTLQLFLRIMQHCLRIVNCFLKRNASCFDLLILSLPLPSLITQALHCLSICRIFEWTGKRSCSCCSNLSICCCIHATATYLMSPSQASDPSTRYCFPKQILLLHSNRIAVHLKCRLHWDMIFGSCTRLAPISFHMYTCCHFEFSLQLSLLPTTFSRNPMLGSFRADALIT